jgi:3-phenylpropionate/cinnamic acid dioxygenase small subunit
MRNLIFAAISSAAVSLASLAAAAEDQARLQPAGYNPDNQMVCIYHEHEGMLLRRPDCRTAQAWATEKESKRQEFRIFQKQNLLVHR